MRLEQGDFERVVAVAATRSRSSQRFAAAGAASIHLVDLDGARSGRSARTRRARWPRGRARARPGVGRRSARSPTPERCSRAGAARVVVGTAAFAAPGAGGATPRRSATGSWSPSTSATAASRSTAGRGQPAASTRPRPSAAPTPASPRLLCTAIERDGTLAGPDLDCSRVSSRVRPARCSRPAGSPRRRPRAVAAAGCEARGRRPRAARRDLPRSRAPAPRDASRRPAYAPPMARLDATRRAELDELRERVAELERERELLNAIANYGAEPPLSRRSPTAPSGRYATNRAFERRLGYEPAETGGVLLLGALRPAGGRRTRPRPRSRHVVAGAEPASFTRAAGSPGPGEVVHVQWSCSAAADDRERPALPPLRRRT